MSDRKRSPLRVPFGKDGALLHHADPEGTAGGHYPAHEWRRAEPIRLQLSLSYGERAASAVYLIWTDAQGRIWPMFFRDAITLMKSRVGVIGGRTAGYFVPVKYNRYYGLAWRGLYEGEAHRGQ